MNHIVLTGLRLLQKEAYAVALRHAWWSEPPDIAGNLAAIHLEVAEATEAYHAEQMALTYQGAKPIGFASELADVVLYAFSIAGAAGVDLGQAVAAKMAYNAGRTSWPRGLRRPGH